MYTVGECGMPMQLGKCAQVMMLLVLLPARQLLVLRMVSPESRYVTDK